MEGYEHVVVAAVGSGTGGRVGYCATYSADACHESRGEVVAAEVVFDVEVGVSPPAQPAVRSTLPTRAPIETATRVRDAVAGLEYITIQTC